MTAATITPIITKPGVEENLAHSVQQHGISAGKPCKTILVGLTTGRYYCAEDGCGYHAEKWSSVFAHRSTHGHEAKAALAARIGAATSSAESAAIRLTVVLAENYELRAQLEAERARRQDAEKRILRVRRAVS